MIANNTQPLYGVIGNPITHSLSPLLHNTAFRHLGIPGILLPWTIAPENISTFTASVRILNIQGVAITLPHKSPILALADSATKQAKMVGAANTLYWDGETLCADNTDVAGFMSPLEKIAPPSSTKVLMLGAGGAARAGIVGLLDQGIRNIFVSSPSGTSADRLADEFGVARVPWKSRCDVVPDIVVNCTPCGMRGKFEGETPYPMDFLRKGTGLAYDMVYTPLHTRFLREAIKSDWNIVTGLEMFIGQANRQFRIWTGHDLPACAIEAVTTALYGKADGRRQAG